MAWQALGDATCELGEAPFWQPDEQRLYWVDIAGKALLRADWATGATERWPMPSEPGNFAPAITSGRPSGWVIALRSGIFRAQHWGAELTCIARLPYDPAAQRANDGKCDPQGRFWVGTRDEQGGTAATMYRVDPPGHHALNDAQANNPLLPQRATVHRMWDGGRTLNGLGWSPDQRTFYATDTPLHRVDQRDWNPATGVPGAPRPLHSFVPKPEGWKPGDARPYGGRPDGAAVDEDGNYWCAMFEGGRVVQLSPDGKVMRDIAVPAACPTMVCLGGPDLRRLIVTTARHGRPPQELTHTPLAGRVLVLNTPVDVPGLLVNPFRESRPTAGIEDAIE